MSNLSDLEASGGHPSVPQLQQPPSQVESNDSGIIPDGLIGQQTTDLTQALLHSNHAEGASNTPGAESDEATSYAIKRKSNVRRCASISCGAEV